MPKRRYRRAKLPTHFSTIGPKKGELLFGYWYLFLPKKNLRSQNQIWENHFLGLQFFPDFGAQIGQQNFFIIWQDGQMSHQSFFMNVSLNGPSGNQSIFGSQIEEKKLTYCTMPNRQYRRAKLLTHFSTIGPNKGKLLFGCW